MRLPSIRPPGSAILIVWIAVACGGPAFVSEPRGSTAKDGGGTEGDGSGPAPEAGVDAPSDDAGLGLSCGTTTCTRATPVCCIGSSVEGTCVSGTCGSGDVMLSCATSGDCAPHLVCCISKGNGVTSSKCLDACPLGGAQLCDSRTQASRCPATAQCSSANIESWNLPLRYGTCGGIKG
jgi:hypothetical protein